MKYVVYLVSYTMTIVVVILAFANQQQLAGLPLYFLVSLALMFLSYPVTLKFFAFLFLAPWQELVQERRLRRHRQPGGYYPLVSVLIPAWNEATGIVATIKTVLASSYQHIEVVVVNDGSTDDSDQVIRTFIEKYERIMQQDMASFPPVLYRYQDNAGKGAALNTGIALAHGELIVCIDADCLMDRDCLLHLVHAFQDTTVMAACGNVKVGNTNTLLSQVQMIEYALSFYSRKTDAILNTLYVISGACGAYRREVFDRIGGYGVALRGGGEDVDMSIRVQQAGLRIAFAPQAIIYTEVPTSLKALAKQRVRWTRSRFETFRTYSRFVFSRKTGHNKLLTCLVIPLIIFNDWFYLLKMALRIGIYLFAAYAHLYQLLTMLMLVSMMVSFPPLWDNREYRKYIFLTPIQWLLSLIPACIEMYAISQALWGIARKRQVVWQAWKRNGVLNP